MRNHWQTDLDGREPGLSYAFGKCERVLYISGKQLSEMDIDKAFAEKFKNSQELIQGTVNVIMPWGDVFTMPIF